MARLLGSRLELRNPHRGRDGHAERSRNVRLFPSFQPLAKQKTQPVTPSLYPQLERASTDLVLIP